MSHSHRLNTAVEEALGAGDCHYRSDFTPTTTATAGGSMRAAADAPRDPHVIKINHAEEEHIGQTSHPAD